MLQELGLDDSLPWQRRHNLKTISRHLEAVSQTEKIMGNLVANKLTYKELSTVLAALRLFQNNVEAGETLPKDFNHFDEVAPLTTEEIDDLCERLNTEEGDFTALKRERGLR